MHVKVKTLEDENKNENKDAMKQIAMKIRTKLSEMESPARIAVTFGRLPIGRKS